MATMSDYQARNTSMSHLSPERLAALVDEPPTAAELAHLAGCAECTRERAAYRNLVELAVTGAATIAAPLTSWEGLRPALAHDGIIDDGRRIGVGHRRARRPWLQVAAALLLTAGGMIGGRISVGAAPLPFNESGTPTRTASLSPDSAPQFPTVEAARAAQTQAQVLYQTATMFIAQHDTVTVPAESPAAMRTRLAALDRTQKVLGEALNEAPYDPVINGYYLTTVGQREATLRQLNTVAPASMKLTSY
jgi:hypothetical protein